MTLAQLVLIVRSEGVRARGRDCRMVRPSSVKQIARTEHNRRMTQTLAGIFVAVCATTCINTHNGDIWRASHRGELPEGDREPPAWLSVFLWIQWGLLIWALFIDWKATLVFYAIVWLAKVLIRAPIFMVGALLLIPVSLLTDRRK